MGFIFENMRGNTLDLSDNPFAYLINIDGQSSVATDISSVVIGSIDGDIVNNMKAQPRTLIMDLRIKSNVEESKRAILNVIKLKQRCSLLWSQNGRVMKINGYVESVDMPRWNNYVTMQVTIHCDQPFWEDINEVVQEINEALGLHYFTENEDMLFFPDEGRAFGEYDFSRTRHFQNNGDVSVGMEIEIVAYDTVTNPIIYDTDGNFFGIGYGTTSKKVVMQAGETIIITTEKGNKTVKKGNVNLLDKIKRGSSWLQLESGNNTFTINSDDESLENMTFSLKFKQRYI